MKRDRAAYMREYRKRQRSELRAIAGQHAGDHMPQPCHVPGFPCDVQTLQEEVRHLKRELAARSDFRPFNTRPFTPVPKK